MKLRFLGTGAATAAPLPFCMCRFCQELRRKGVFRRRASLLINDEMIIDFGPDVPQAAAEMNVDLTRVHTVLQTHSHADHFDPGHIVTRIPGYAAQGQPELLLMGSPLTMTHIREKLLREEGDADIENDAHLSAMNMAVRAVAPGKPVYTCRYDILPIAVPHDESDGSVIYLISEPAAGKAILYATDCPVFTDEVWQILSNYKLDCAVMDHTYGAFNHEPCRSHMDAHQFAETAGRLRKEGILKPGAPVYATHISHEAHGSIAEMTAFAAAHNYILPDDGCVTEI